MHINAIFKMINIHLHPFAIMYHHLPAILMLARGTRFRPIPIYWPEHRAPSCMRISLFHLMTQRSLAQASSFEAALKHIETYQGH